MAAKKKVYRRFEELTKRAMAPAAGDAEPAQGPMNPRSGDTDMGSSETLPIHLNPQVRRALETRAAADNTTPSEIVQEALRRYLQTPRFR
jgi:hypothetical protein